MFFELLYSSNVTIYSFISLYIYILGRRNSVYGRRLIKGNNLINCIWHIFRWLYLVDGETKVPKPALRPRPNPPPRPRGSAQSDGKLHSQVPPYPWKSSPWQIWTTMQMDSGSYILCIKSFLNIRIFDKLIEWSCIPIGE